MPKLSLKIDKDTQEVNKYLASFSKKSKIDMFKDMTQLLIKNVSSKEDILKLKAYKTLLETQDEIDLQIQQEEY